MCCQGNVLLESCVEGYLGLRDRWVRRAGSIHEGGLKVSIRENVGELSFPGTEALLVN